MGSASAPQLIQGPGLFRSRRIIGAQHGFYSTIPRFVRPGSDSPRILPSFYRWEPGVDLENVLEH